MRVTIVAEDGLVIVEGQGEIVDLSSLDEEIHAIQWYGTVGDVEYKHDYVENKRKPNSRIADFAPYQKYVDLWTIEAKKLLPTPVANAA